MKTWSAALLACLLLTGCESFHRVNSQVVEGPDAGEPAPAGSAAELREQARRSATISLVSTLVSTGLLVAALAESGGDDGAGAPLLIGSGTAGLISIGTLHHSIRKGFAADQAGQEEWERAFRELVESAADDTVGVRAATDDFFVDHGRPASTPLLSCSAAELLQRAP